MSSGGSRRASRGTVVAGVLLALVLPVTVPPGPEPAHAARATTTADNSAATLTTDEKAFGFRLIRWIRRLSASAPTGPPEFRAYELLRQGRCLTLSTSLDDLDLNPTAKTLYGGAANACRAAFAGRRRLWPDAVEAFRDVRLATDEFTCMDRAAFGLLKRLVRAHQRFPNARFRLADSSQAKTPPCPIIDSVEPDHGVAGTDVVISGRFLDRYLASVDVIFFDSDGAADRVSFENLTPVDGRLVVTMPASNGDSSRVVCLAVRSDPDWDSDGATWTYDATEPGDDSVPMPTCPPPPQN